eukprot:gene8919-6402_t
MNDLASTISGGAIAMPDPEQMDRRLILKRAHQNSSGSSGSEPDSKNLRKRLNVGESGDSMRSMTSGTTTENDVFHKYVGPPHQQPSGGDTHAYDVMDDLAQRIEPVHRPIEVFEKLDDSLFDGAGPFGDFEGTDEDDGFLHDDGLMMWDDGDDLVAGPPGDAAAAAAAAATAARDEVTQLVAGLDDGRKEALKSLLARSANGTAPDSLGHDVRSILSASLSHSTDSFAGGAGHLHVLIDDPAHAFDPSTLQYLREAMLSDGDGGGGGLEPMSISGKSDRSDAPTKRSNGRAKANRTPTTTVEDSSTPTSQSSATSSSRRKTAAQKRKEEQEKEKAAAAGLLRGNYRCGRCGLPKVNHVCQFVDTVGSHVAVQVEAPILDVVTGLPFEGERFLSISAANSPAPSQASHKSMAMAVVSPRSTLATVAVADGGSGRYAAAAAASAAYDSMDVDDASSTVSFGVPAASADYQRSVGSPLWAHPPPPPLQQQQSRVLQGQLAMSLDGYEYVDQQQYAAMAPAVQNPLLMGQFYHPQPPPDPSSFGAGPFYPPPPMHDPSAATGPFYPPPQDDAAPSTFTFTNSIDPIMTDVSFVGYMAVPTNRPVVTEFRSLLLNPPSEDDRKYGLLVSTDIVRENNTFFEDLEIAGVCKIRTDLVTLTKENYHSILAKQGSPEKLARLEKESGSTIAELEAKVLGLQEENVAQKEQITALQAQVLAQQDEITTLKAQG